MRSVQRLNSYELTGVMQRSAPGQALDDMVLEHLMVQRELRNLDAREEVLVRMLAEDYSMKEIATELGVCVRTVWKVRSQLREKYERAA